MTKCQKLIIVLGVISSFIACKNNKINSSEIKGFYGSHIELSLENMEKLTTLEPLYNPNMQNIACRVIVFRDTTACSTCEIMKLHEWEDLVRQYQIEKNINIDVTHIFSPSKQDYKKLKGTIKIMKSNIPVYIDTARVFTNQNICIPSNNLFHTFVIDEKNNVVIIGNILQNERIKNLFTEYIDSTLTPIQ